MPTLNRAPRFAVALALLVLPCRAFDVAGDTVPAVNSLPRIALVIGNSRYRDLPLRNPGNDASAIAGQLQRVGFSVTLKTDAGRDEMLAAMRSFGSSLRETKGVGLFFFAGHGAQLAWRNYLIPVDAVIRTPQEMQAQAVDMNALIDDLARARNPMNIVILDACRDNPFGSQVMLAQKGLSQLDAPAGTLLAYATAPGNVAADGTGSNGLYTEHLLKEMQAREAKIEDVFKRVRLNVRRVSRGQQIPWESTSLEQDFYLIPPVAAKQIPPEELERRFEEELEIWMRIRATRETALLEDFLRRFPSGKFSELAQFRLDRLLAQQGEKPVEIAPTPAPEGVPAPRTPAPGAPSAALVRLAQAGTPAGDVATAVPPVSNPYTRGTTRADWNYRIGDTYTYTRMDAFSKVPDRQFTERVTDVTDLEVIYNRGRRTTDLLGNDIVDRAGREYSPSQVFVAEYAVGKKWTTRFHVVRPQEARLGKKGLKPREDEVEIDFRVVAREPVTVAAGTFDAYRVEGHGSFIRSATALKYVYWIAPARVRRVLALEIYVKGSGGKRQQRADRFELTSYSQRGDARRASVVGLLGQKVTGGGL